MYVYLSIALSLYILQKMLAKIVIFVLRSPIETKLYFSGKDFHDGK